MHRRVIKSTGFSIVLLRICLITHLFPSLIHTYDKYLWSTAVSKYMTTCKEKECHERAKVIQESMNRHADPCDDFYEYACGSWRKKNPIPSFKNEWSVEAKLDFKALQQMTDLLKEKPNSHDSLHEKKAKEYFHICNNIPSLGMISAKDLKPFVKKAGPWPMFERGIDSKVSWLDIHNYYLQLTGESGLFHISLNYKCKEHSVIIRLSNKGAPIGLIIRFGEWSNSDMQKYQHFLLNLARRVVNENKEPPEKDLLQDIVDVINFRLKLETDSITEEMECTPISLKHFNTWYDVKTTSQKGGVKIRWVELFQNLLKNTGLSVTEETLIDVPRRDSFANFPRLISNTPKHVIANHLHLHFIERHILNNKELNTALTMLLISNGKIIGNTAPRRERQFACVINHPMKQTLGDMYVKKHFSPDSRTEIMNYGNLMKDTIKLHLRDSEWLNKETKQMLISKIDDLNLNIGYQSVRTEGTPKNPMMTPYRAISFYLPKENELFISAGYFQSPVYSPNLPTSINYGTISAFIAYEMYHALNVHHFHTEPKINKNECKYCWPENMLKPLAEKSKCFVNLYTDLVEEELNKIKPLPKTNGEQTLFENVADIMGIETAIEAFKQNLWTKHGKCRILPHLKDLTCEKLFFLSYAVTFCTESPVWRLLKHSQMGTHTTPRLRVNVPLANMKEFKQAFQCSPQSPMVKKKQCFLW